MRAKTPKAHNKQIIAQIVQKRIFHMLKLIIAVFAIMFGMVQHASAATDFASALPTSLIPDGFWALAGLALALVIAIAGVTIAIKLIRRAS
ncbi:hypothetical protein KKG72_04740 [bacterium]|nr:hypothetical protein [bacterium]